MPLKVLSFEGIFINDASKAHVILRHFSITLLKRKIISGIITICQYIHKEAF